MPQTPGGGTGGDPNQAKLIQKALANAGITVSLSWIEAQMEGGMKASEIVSLAQQKFGGSDGSGGGGGSLEDVLDGIFSGGSGSSGSGSSGSSSSGSSEPTAAQKAAMHSNYIEILRRWGLQPGQGGLENLIQHAISSEWTTTQFMQAVRKTKPYKQAFVGIRWKEGMTEAEYMRLYGQYRELAGNAGRGLNKQQFGSLLQKGVTGAEFKLRVDALDRMSKQAGLFNAFEQVLKARGLIKPNAQLSKGELYKFITRRGDPAWERVWQEAVVTQGFRSAGITVGKGGGNDFSRKELLGLINQVDTSKSEVENLTTADFQKLATMIQEKLPLSQLYGKGVTKQDLAVLALGGRGAVEIAQRVQEIDAQFNLSKEEKANAQFVQTGPNKTSLSYGGIAGEAGE
jgi:hypothetical protein